MYINKKPFQNYLLFLYTLVYNELCKKMIKQLLNSVLEKYSDLSVGRRPIICVCPRHWQIRINNLVLNFKKGKTECVMFGTSQKLSKVSDIGPLNITVNGSKINESATYKYLGVTLDKNLTFSEHLLSTFRKASARVKLLRRIRHCISPL